MMRAADCVLGIDLGTSSLKCVLMRADGRVLAAAERSYPTASPAPGWAEQNPLDWLAALQAALAEIKRVDASFFDRVGAIGMCSAAHIPVLLDAAGDVMRPAILWSDQRSDAQVTALQAKYGDLLAASTLNEAGCTWTLPQLLWIGEHEPHVLPRVRHFLSSKDYLVFSLTGEARMDFGSAAATLMLDARTKSWSSALCALSGLPLAAFPALASPLDVVGSVSDAAHAVFGLPAGIPVIAGALDSAAELVGCDILRAGRRGMVRVGSAGGIMALTEAPSFDAGIITYPHVAGDIFYKQAGTNACATSLKWLRQLCAGVRRGHFDAAPPLPSFDDLDALAQTVAPGADGLLFHPYLHGERAPYWNPELRANFSGIDQAHAWPHFVRAVMEGVAYSLRDCLGMFERAGIRMCSAVMAGGVARSPVWAQIIADVLGMEMHTVRGGDSALGACLLAATAGGLFSSIEAAATACVVPEKTIVPVAANRDLYAERFERYRRVARFLDADTAWPSPGVPSGQRVAEAPSRTVHSGTGQCGPGEPPGLARLSG